MTDTDLDLLRHDRAALVRALEDAGAKFRGAGCTCPFHADADPSAGIYRTEAGAWKFKCQVRACAVHGDISDVIARATGKPLADVLREHAGPPRRSAAPADPERKNLRVYPTVDALRAGISGWEATYVYSR